MNAASVLGGILTRKIHQFVLSGSIAGCAVLGVAGCDETLVVEQGIGSTVVSAQDPDVSTILKPRLVLVADQPVIVYYDDSAGALFAAFPTETSWATERLGGGPDTPAGRHLAAVADGNGTIHIAYRDDDAGDIRYVSGGRGDWSGQDPLPAGEDRGLGLDIAVDLGGNPWIAYRNETTQAIEVVYLSNDVWQIERVDSDGNTGLWPRIATDLGGRATVAYRNGSDNSVRLATFESVGQWDLQTVEQAPDGAIIGEWTSLAMRPAFSEDLTLVFPRLLYMYDLDSTYALRYSLGVTTSEWESGFVDPAVFGGTDNCLAVAGNGDLYVSYLDNTTLDLRVAVRRGGSWRTAIADSDSAAGFYSSCAIDSAGSFHIAYGVRSEDSATIRYKVLREL